MTNPFARWTPEMVAHHNSRMEAMRTAHGAKSRPLPAQPIQTPAPPIKTPPRARQRAKQPAPGSHLEVKFLNLWQSVGGPALEMEYRFHPKRRWRSDFCHHASRTLIEIEGGAWSGRHTTGRGFLADAEKYLAAFVQGWQVVRLTAPQLTRENVLAVAMRCGLLSPSALAIKSVTDPDAGVPVVPATAGNTTLQT